MLKISLNKIAYPIIIGCCIVDEQGTEGNVLINGCSTVLIGKHGSIRVPVDVNGCRGSAEHVGICCIVSQQTEEVGICQGGIIQDGLSQRDFSRCKSDVEKQWSRVGAISDVSNLALKIR